MLFGKYLSEQTASGDAHLVMGLFSGLTISTLVVMLQQLGVWSAEWSLIGSLSTVSHKDDIFCAFCAIRCRRRRTVSSDTPLSVCVPL